MIKKFFVETFGFKPKNTPFPKVVVPVEIGQAISLGKDIWYHIESISKKEVDSNTWCTNGKVIIRLPNGAENPNVQPMITGGYHILKYFVTYNLSDGDAGLIKIASEGERTFTDIYGRERLVKMDVTQVETEK